MTTFSRALVPLLLACAGPLAAQGRSPGNRWHTVLTAEDGTTASIDTAMAFREGDTAFVVRTAFRLASPMALATGERVDRQVVAEALDCAGGRSSHRGTELYVADTVVATAPEVPGWAAVAPERRSVFDATCAFLRAGFADRLRARRQDEKMPELANVATVRGALRREYGALRTTGTVNVRFRVREDGTVDAGSMAVVDFTQPELAEPAKRVAAEMRFRPARVGGWAVPVWVTLPITFRPES